MKVRYVCKCGSYNFNLEDWLSHWRYDGILECDEMIAKYGKFLCQHPKLRAVYMFLLTRVEFAK